jgi:hypothetical protein
MAPRPRGPSEPAGLGLGEESDRLILVGDLPKGRGDLLD